MPDSAETLANDRTMRRRRALRRLLAVVALLLAGLMVSLAFAAVGVLLHHRAGRNIPYERMDDAFFAGLQRRFTAPPEGFPLVTTHAPLDPRNARAARGFAWRVGSADTVWHQAMPARHTLAVHRAGWPLTCLEGRHWSEMLIEHAKDGRSGAFRGGAVVRDGLREIDARWMSGPARAATLDVPVAPRWPGLVIDTALWAAVIGLLLRGPGCARRRFRILRGRCVACGYHLHGLDRCPECGQATTTTAQRP